MADIREQDLALKTSISDTDWIRLVTPTGNHRMTVGQFKDLIGYTSLQQRTQDLEGKVLDLEENAISHLADYETLQTAYEKGKFEYVYIPAETQQIFRTEESEQLLLFLHANSDDYAYAVLVSRFPTYGFVRTMIHDDTRVTFASNSGKTNFYITPTHSMRGILIRVKL